MLSNHVFWQTLSATRPPHRWYYRAGLVFWPTCKRLATTVRADPARQALRLHSMLVSGVDGNVPTQAAEALIELWRLFAYVHTSCDSSVGHIRGDAGPR